MPPSSVCSASPMTEQATLSPAADTLSSSSRCSPRSAGGPAGGSSSRFGFQDCSPAAGSSCAPTPRSAKRSGVTTFTDPMNPFGRTSSKQVSPSMLQDARNDASRAGARTKNSGILMMDHVSPKECRERLVVHRYGNQDWRPSKGAATAGPAASGRSPRGVNSEGVGSALGGSSAAPAAAPASQPKGSAALGNYLNDMKRAGRAKRATNEKPSDFLQRMNDTMHHLPVERRQRRSQSLDAVGRESLGTPRRNHVSAESEGEDAAAYGFARKRPVSGLSARASSGNFLSHEEACSQPATPRTERQHKADQRFDEVVAHMKATSPTWKEQSQSIKVKSENTHRLLYNEQVVKHAV